MLSSILLQLEIYIISPWKLSKNLIFVLEYPQFQ